MSNAFPYAVLNNNLKMPMTGRTYKIQGHEACFSVLNAALKFGYRLLDTAQVYKNEKEIGDCLQELLKQYNLTRDDIFITSKIAPNNHGYDKCIESVQKTIENLQLKYVDLFLIHWPGVRGKKTDDHRLASIRRRTWEGLEFCYEKGFVKAIGVSNYTRTHLDELYEYAKVEPMVLQTEFHPFLWQKELLSYCKSKSIVFQAYSSLGTSDPTFSNNFLTNPLIATIANKYGKTNAQILLKWSLQQGAAVIPKSTNPKHIEDNMNLFEFEINENDMDAISNLNQNLHCCWNPETIL